MAPKQKRRSVMDTLRDLLDKLNQLGPLLGPRSLQPVPVPVRNPERRRR
jgi:ribosomal protein L1